MSHKYSPNLWEGKAGQNAVSSLGWLGASKEYHKTRALRPSFPRKVVHFVVEFPIFCLLGGGKEIRSIFFDKAVSIGR